MFFILIIRKMRIKRALTRFKHGLIKTVATFDFFWFKIFKPEKYSSQKWENRDSGRWMNGWDTLKGKIVPSKWFNEDRNGTPIYNSCKCIKRSENDVCPGLKIGKKQTDLTVDDCIFCVLFFKHSNRVLKRVHPVF